VNPEVRTDAWTVDPRLQAWEHRMNPVIVVAAILPIVVAVKPQGADDPYAVINIVSWLVFLADLLVHLKLEHRYLRTGLGKFDLGIVVLTFPWYLLPGFGAATGLLGLARLGRIGRLIIAGGTTHVLRRLIARLGKAGLYSLALIVTCSEVVYRAEPPSSGFTTHWDSLWGGFVTFTTVGYGDLVPVTETGRTAAIVLMVGGVALIGLLAGSLAEFLDEAHADDEPAEPVLEPPDNHVLLGELRSLRTEIAALQESIGRQ